MARSLRTASAPSTAVSTAVDPNLEHRDSTLPSPFDAIPIACGGTQVAADAETACEGGKYVFEGPIRAQCIGLGDVDL